MPSTVFASGWIRPPRVCAGLAVRGPDVEPPHLLAITDSDCANPTARGPLGACRPDVDELSVNQWRHADEVAFLRICNLLGPKRVPVFRIERQQEAISGASNDLSGGECRASLRIHRLVIARRPFVRPDHVAIGAVESDGVVSSRQIHNARGHYRSAFQWLSLRTPIHPTL